MTEGVSIPVSIPSSQAPAAAAPEPAAPAAPAAPESQTPAPAAPAEPVVEPKAGDPPKAADLAPEPNVDPNAPPKAPDAPTAFKIPDEYKDKPWASKVTSEAELWKQLANTQELIGKKSIVPDLKTATPEQKEEFYKQMRPADASAYKFTGDMASPAIKEGVGKMFMENGISEVQGNAIIEQYSKMGEDQQAQLFDPEGFKTAMKGTFGENWEGVRDGIHQNLGKLMTPEDYTLMEKNLPNAYVNLIYRTLGNTQAAIDNMMKRYGVKETSLAHFADKSTNMGGGDVETQRANIRADMAKMKQGPFTAEAYSGLQQKLAKTYENDPRIERQG